MLIKQRRRHSSVKNKAPPSSWLSKSGALTLRETCQWFLLLKWWPDFYSLLQFVSKFSVLHGSDHVVQREEKRKWAIKSIKSFKILISFPKKPYLLSWKHPKEKPKRFLLSAEKHPVHCNKLDSKRYVTEAFEFSSCLTALSWFIV